MMDSETFIRSQQIHLTAEYTPLADVIVVMDDMQASCKYIAEKQGSCIASATFVGAPGWLQGAEYISCSFTSILPTPQVCRTLCT
jgi:hypothetical protein